MLVPRFDGPLNFFRSLARAHFPNPGAILRQQRHQLGKIDIAGKWWLMVLRRPNAILNVTTESSGTDLAQPISVIEKREIFFDLNVSEVVPVTNLGRVEFIQQRGKLPFARNFFVTAAAFDSEFYFFARRVLDHAFQTTSYLFDIRRGGGFARLDRANFFANIFAGK